MAERREKDRLPVGWKKHPERESGNERRSMDGYSKRQAERTELCGMGKEVPHRSANSKAVCGITTKTGERINRTETDKAGREVLPVMSSRTKPLLPVML